MVAVKEGELIEKKHLETTGILLQHEGEEQEEGKEEEEKQPDEKATIHVKEEVDADNPEFKLN